MNLLRTFLLSAIIIFSLKTNAQDLLQTNGQAIVNSVTGDTVILRGMGLGGWMLQEGYMLQTASFAGAQYQIRNKIQEVIGESNTDLFYEKWLENHVRKADIDSLAAWGFNHVRLPMHYNLYTLPVEDEPVVGENTWLDKGFIMTDSLISWCKQNNMWVVLDLHAAPGGQGYDQGISDYDPSKPSLWESSENRSKMVALWRRLAERYVDEPAVAAYDLLNEPNWDLPGGTLLRTLYEQVTTAIREVDQNHIIIIEGNWFANDFTGLTPPWDDNMAYGPHKYWSINDQASIQWILDIRNNHNVPLYLGESGENSNVWFRDAIKLLEDNDIGWAWWPMKKIEAIAGPLSVEKSDGYQQLLTYWEGNGSAPSASAATATLFDLTEKLKIENCFYQKDVIDAMFRQVQDDETQPFKPHTIPGVIQAVDFDLGRNGYAYSDSDDATYHVSSGSFTAWNSGWAYRNDGVDIERSFDAQSNGFGVGFTQTGEWLQYEVEVTEEAVYSISLRIANGSTDGAFSFSIDGAVLSTIFYTPNTGGYQNWETISISDVVLTPGVHKLKLHIEEGGFNVGKITFTDEFPSTDIDAKFISAYTLDAQTIHLNLNKPMVTSNIDLTAGFQVFVNGSEVTVTDVQPDVNNPRIIYFTVDYTFASGDVIKISFPDNDPNDLIVATDATPLEVFIQKPVENRESIIHIIPGRIEAEDFSYQEGVQIENAQDVGGGQSLGFLDAGDFIEYEVDVISDGVYRVDYRTASDAGSNGQIQLLSVDAFGNETSLQQIVFAPTGGWQTWETNSKTAMLEAGRQTIRVLIAQGSFNLNWIEFSDLTSTDDLVEAIDFDIYPNPTDGEFFVFGKIKNTQDVEIQIFDLLGRQVFSKKINNVQEVNERVELSNWISGNYFVKIQTEDGQVFSKKIIKQ